VQVQQHPGVAEGVGLDPVEVEELGHALVVGAEQFGVHLGGHRGGPDGLEAVPGEEADLEGQHEHPLHADLAGRRHQGVHEAATDPVAAAGRVDGHRADLGEVFPQHVQRAAAHDGAVGPFGDPELLDVLVERHGRLVQQPPGSGVGVDQFADRPDVAGSRAPDRVVHCLHPSDRDHGGPPRGGRYEST